MDNTAFGKTEKSGVLGFLKEPKKLIAVIVAAVVIIVLIIVFAVSGGGKANAEASDKLSQAYASFSVGNQDAGLALLNDLIENYSKTPAAYQARLFLGDYYTSVQNYPEALRFLLQTSNDAKPEDLRPLALARIVNIWDIRNEFVNAKDAAQEFVNKYPDHFLTKSIYLSLARYYALIGDVDNVRRVCNEILVKFPGSEEATIADNTIKSLA
ncbi:MAG: tetratricopeptide repeat protein [Elusimicrobiota bacterium]|jgi:predicted negative regulator of RcsB-dependent stress response|nr:tetratricopeptide repeat protein [Elusimicrobiota bacterium]